MLLALGGSVLIAYAFLLRCFHLLNSDHYYMISADSYFFHWLAGKVMAGEELPAGALPGAITGILHSGLTYPLVYIAKAASYVFGISSADALALVCKFLPPVLGVISLVVIYLVARKVCDRLVGLFAALVWATMMSPVFFGAAGYVDRDGLSILLVAIGAFLFYLSGYWHLRIGGRDIGWLLAGLGVLGIEVLLYLEWSFVGPVLLLVILIAYFVVRTIVGYSDRLQTEPSAIRRLRSAIGEANWRTFTVVALGNLLGAAINMKLAASVFTFGRVVIQIEGESGIAEMQGITLGHIIGFSFLLIPIAVGLYLVWKTRSGAAIFFSSWFISLLILSLFANRVLLYASPAACLLAGVGLAFLWRSMKQGTYHLLKKTGVAVLLCLLVLPPFSQAYHLGSNPVLAMNQEWQDAMAYIRENTTEDALIISQWGWGYWILDQGQRRPVVDNGFYGWDHERLHDVGIAYATTDPSEAAQIMEKYGADYLIFSELDLDFCQTILGWAGFDEKYKGFDGFPSDSLITRSLSSQFESGGGLEVVYRSAPDSEVVILRLTHPR